MIKSVQSMNSREVLQPEKDNHDKLQQYTYWWNVEHFPPKIGNKANILLSLFNTVLACPIKQEKRTTNEKRRVKNVLFTDRMIWLKYSVVLRHYSKLNYRFSSIPNTILAALFVERNKLFSILKWKSKGPRKEKNLEEPRWRTQATWFEDIMKLK